MTAARRRSGVTVEGTGTAIAAVDRVRVSIGISETRPDAGEAFRAAAATATTVLGILADDGADSRSVRTDDLTLVPRILWRDGVETFAGYQAGQRLTVSLTGLSGMERMLTDVATKSGGGVRIDGLTLTPSDPTRALREAREAAVGDARSKAEELARLVGRELGLLEWIQELPAAPNQAIAAGEIYRGAAGGGTPMPLAPGDSTVSVTVSAHWAFAE